MTKPLEMFHATAFDPDTVKVLCDAYEKARKSLHDTDQPSIANEVVAERIFRLALQGERDADRLCERRFQRSATKRFLKSKRSWNVRSGPKRIFCRFVSNSSLLEVQVPRALIISGPPTCGKI